MKISLDWLRDFIDLHESPEHISQLLTSTGLEVEALVALGPGADGLAGVVVGEIISAAKHPQADRLSLTTVNIGEAAPVSIVCGAPNVAAGQKVLVAKVGATLNPKNGTGPLTIKKARIRGEISEGMICAEDELGIGNSHEGILVLETELPPGTPAKEWLGRSGDIVLEIGLTPNRADAASHLGVARDLKAVLDRPIRWPSIEGFAVGAENRHVSVKVENVEAAPRYCGLTITGLMVGPSPQWLTKRLEAIGLRPINNVVDITNYVCHELGQPLHAFDLQHVSGREILIKTLPSGTRFVTLDGTERTLSEEDLMICDQEKPLCIAGVFGGLDSGVTEKTTEIFLEAAYFSPIWVRKTSQRHGLKTDSSFRFERGTDPEMPPFALRRAAMLIEEISGGKVASEPLDIYSSPLEPVEVMVSYPKMNRLIGKEIPKTQIKKILNNLDIILKDETKNGFKAVVPAFRVDVHREADIVEEILRIYGFDNVEISQTLKSDFLADFPVNDPSLLRTKVTETLVANGFYETLNNSLTRSSWQETLWQADYGAPVAILNPLSEDLAAMRQTMLFQSLETVAHNVNRKQRDLKIFEFGKTYHHFGGRYEERPRLSLTICGNVTAESWRAKPRNAGFYDLVDEVERVLSAMRISRYQVKEGNDAQFDYCVTYSQDKKILVTLGEVASGPKKLLDIKIPVFYADFDWRVLLGQYTSALIYQEVPKFPEVRRELSIVIDPNVTYDQVKKVALGVEKKLITSIQVVDVYQGDNLEGKKSYSLSFVLQDSERTLTDSLIEAVMNRLIAAFETDLKAVIRR